MWTIGFSSTRDAEDHPITSTTPPVAVAQAKALVARDLRGAFAAVIGAVHVTLNADQEAALADFLYNLQIGAFRSSTLLRDINAGNFEAAAERFPLWDHAGGKVLAGLLWRREAEQALFERPASSSRSTLSPPGHSVARPITHYDPVGPAA